VVTFTPQLQSPSVGVDTGSFCVCLCALVVVVVVVVLVWSQCSYLFGYYTIFLCCLLVSYLKKP